VREVEDGIRIICLLYISYMRWSFIIHITGAIMKNFIISFIFIIFTTQSYAVYDIAKTNDWKWHAHICKNVSIHLSIIAQMEQNHGTEKINSQQEFFKKRIAKTILQNEKEIVLDESDAMIIANIVFAVRSGLKEAGYPLNSQIAMNQGFNICTYLLEKLDKKLLNANTKNH